MAAFHLSFLLGEPRYGGRETFHAVTVRGCLGVDFFFVLSGFILTYTYRDELATRSPRDFYVARVARIYPNILFALALASISTVWLLATSVAELNLKGAKQKGIASALVALWPYGIPEALSAKDRNLRIAEWLEGEGLSVPDDLGKAVQVVLQKVKAHASNQR